MPWHWVVLVKGSINFDWYSRDWQNFPRASNFYQWTVDREPTKLLVVQAVGGQIYYWTCTGTCSGSSGSGWRCWSANIYLMVPLKSEAIWTPEDTEGPQSRRRENRLKWVWIVIWPFYKNLHWMNKSILWVNYTQLQQLFPGFFSTKTIKNLK